jgi:NAD(P)-dependent dehydrogenase (short-subunit alcohol dehydrogenase family)
METPTIGKGSQVITDRTASSFEGKAVLVTGSARGLGLSVALSFAKQGASVAIADIDEVTAREAARAISELNRRACVITADICDQPSAERVVQQTVADLGGLDILVNNAGVASVEPFLEISENEWDRVFGVNVKGVLFCLQAAARVLKERGGGKIINVSSPASRMGLPLYVAYAASKAAVDSITRSGAVALAKYNITVNSVAPGRMDTDMQRMTEEKFAMHAGMSVESYVKSRTQGIPLGRRTSPEEVAQAILWLAGPQADYITGHRLCVSGGLEIS